MTSEQDRIAYYNEELVKRLFKPWISALKTQPIEDVLADPSLRTKKWRNRVRK